MWIIRRTYETKKCLKAFLKLDFESAIKIENFNDKQKNYHENFLPLLSFSLQLKYIIYYDVKKESIFGRGTFYLIQVACYFYCVTFLGPL